MTNTPRDATTVANILSHIVVPANATVIVNNDLTYVDVVCHPRWTTSGWITLWDCETNRLDDYMPRWATIGWDDVNACPRLDHHMIGNVSTHVDRDNMMTIVFT